MFKAFGPIALAIALAVAPGGALAQSLAPTSGTVSIEPQPSDPNIASAVPAFVDAIGNAFMARGFTVIEGAGHAALSAEVKVTRTDLGMTRAKVKNDKATVGPGAAAGVGAGASFALGSGAQKDVALEQTRVEIRIRKRGESLVLWHGAALTVRASDTPKGRDSVIAADLAEAVLRAYPNQTPDTISIP